MYTLLFINLLLLVLLEVTLEVIYGDKHDLISNLRLTGTVMIASIMGLLINSYLGVPIYFFLRVAIFDLAFSKIKMKEWFYLGSNKTDLEFKKLPVAANLFVRITSLIIAVTLTYITYTYEFI
jgi:type III secretory pathway component EscU